jgi:hypothetical protein
MSLDGCVYALFDRISTQENRRDSPVADDSPYFRFSAVQNSLFSAIPLIKDWAPLSAPRLPGEAKQINALFFL